jgi:hypothetical protein
MLNVEEEGLKDLTLWARIVTKSRMQNWRHGQELVQQPP